MEEKGEVIGSSNDEITVRFERKTECAKCKMCSFNKDASFFDIKLKNTVNAKTGDTVLVSMSGSVVLISSFIVYLIPLFCTAAGLILGNALFGENIAVVFSVVFLVAGFFLVAFCDKYLKKKNKVKLPQVIRLIKKEDVNQQVM